MRPFHQLKLQSPFYRYSVRNILGFLLSGTDFLDQKDRLSLLQHMTLARNFSEPQKIYEAISTRKVVSLIEMAQIYDLECSFES